ncbi:propanediol utilization protein [Pseudomonas sp. PCH446]
MSDQDTMLVEITGNYRSGTSGKGNPIACLKAMSTSQYAYPEKASFYAEKVSEVPQAGTYRVPFKFQVKDGRVAVDFDPRNGIRTELPSLSSVRAQPKTA